MAHPLISSQSLVSSQPRGVYPPSWRDAEGEKLASLWRSAKDSINLVAFQTMFLVPGPRLTMLGLYAFPVRTSVLVVINLTVLRWIFG